MGTVSVGENAKVLEPESGEQLHNNVNILNATAPDA